jgi:hypothetical protein
LGTPGLYSPLLLQADPTGFKTAERKMLRVALWASVTQAGQPAFGELIMNFVSTGRLMLQAVFCFEQLDVCYSQGNTLVKSTRRAGMKVETGVHSSPRCLFAEKHFPWLAKHKLINNPPSQDYADHMSGGEILDSRLTLAVFSPVRLP